MEKITARYTKTVVVNFNGAVSVAKNLYLPFNPTHAILKAVSMKDDGAAPNVFAFKASFVDSAQYLCGGVDPCAYAPMTEFKLSSNVNGTVTFEVFDELETPGGFDGAVVLTFEFQHRE